MPDVYWAALSVVSMTPLASVSYLYPSASLMTGKRLFCITISTKAVCVPSGLSRRVYGNVSSSLSVKKFTPRKSVSLVEGISTPIQAATISMRKDSKSVWPISKFHMALASRQKVAASHSSHLEGTWYVCLLMVRVIIVWRNISGLRPGLFQGPSIRRQMPSPCLWTASGRCSG